MFEKNRNNSLRSYKLCPSHCLSAPGLCWDEIINMTKVELELISDADLYLFFKMGMSGKLTINI